MSRQPRPLLLPVLVWCLLAAWLCASAQQTHIVDVGLGGNTTFTDRDTGRNNFNVSPVPTVVRVGDSVQWIFQYQHSSTSGSCPNFNCQPNGIWDSTIRNFPFPNTFQRSFTSTGVFPYFCLVHLSAMQGEVIVLNGPEFVLKVPNNQTFPPPPIPTFTVLAGQIAPFNGTIAGFLGYNSAVNLSCQNGSPRVPSFCPGSTATPDGAGAEIPFIFPVSDATAGSYTFDLVATGVDANHVTKVQQVRLNVADMAVSNLSPDVVNVPPGSTSPSINTQVQAIGGFTGSVSLNCNGVPAGATCFVFPNSLNFTFGGTTSQSVAMLVDPGSAAPGIYPLQLVASSFFMGAPVTRSRPLTFRLLPADHFTITAPPNAAPNSPVLATVRVVDRNGNPIVNYGGTVHLSSTDPLAVIPQQDYTFDGPNLDRGVHDFQVTFKTVGPRTITVTDTSPFALQVTSGLVKVDTVSPNNSIEVQSSRVATVPPHFRDESVTLTATVSSASGTPSGTVRFFDGARELGSAILSSSTPGIATAKLTVRSLRPGGHSLFAAYEGTASFSANLSLEISQPRSPAPRCQADQCP